VAWEEAFSDAVAVVSEVDEEVVWEEFRWLKELILLLLLIDSVLSVPKEEDVVAAAGADWAVLLSEPPVLLMLVDEDERESDEALFTNTLCGRCLNFVK
jgi:hypothetical protein